MLKRASPFNKLSELSEAIATRKLARYYPWILLGVILVYVLTFPIFKYPALVIIPVLLAGWFYYQRGGLIASAVAVICDYFLITTFISGFDVGRLSGFANDVVGHLILTGLGTGIGYIRREFESFYRVDRQLRSRERHLTLVNITTRDLFEMKNSGEVYYHLLVHLANLFVADYAHLTHWDESGQFVALLASTKSVDSDHLMMPLNPQEAQATLEVLQTGHVLPIAEVATASFVVNPSFFGESVTGARSAMVIPLTTRGYKFGAVVLVFNTPQQFDLDEYRYFELIGTQITLSLKTIDQERKIERQLKEAQALHFVERALSESEMIGLDAVLELIVNSAKDLVPNANDAILHLLDQDKQYLIPRAARGSLESGRTKMRLGEGVAGTVLFSGKPIAISDVRADPRFVGQTLSLPYRSLVVVPVEINDRRIGTLSIHSEKVGVFDAGQINLLVSLGTQAAIAIENANLLETTRQDLQEINALYHVTRNLTIALDPNIIMSDVVNYLHPYLGCHQVQIFLHDPETGYLAASQGAGVVGNKLAEQHYALPPAIGIVGHVMQTGEPFIANDANEVIFYFPNPLLPEVKSELAIPIQSTDKTLGVLDVIYQSPHTITLREMRFMKGVAGQLALALQRAAIHNDLQTSLHQEKTMRTQLMQSERLAMVGRLLASISHELNNPLQAIQNALFLLKGEENLTSQGRQDLDVVLSETERMTSLISRLRATYRPTVAEDFRDVELNTIIEDVYALTSTYMRHRKIAFEFSPDPELPIVPGVPDQIRQVMLNLFMNAVDAMNPDGKLIVETHRERDEDRVLVIVSDTGRGIAPDILPHIFEPFVTDKDTGTGLGMTIARDIILQHNGEIHAENHPGGGARFAISLPIKNSVRV